VTSTVDVLQANEMPRVLAFLLAAAVAVPSSLLAQEEVVPVLSGRVLISGTPADSGTVILHRVTPEEAGRIDSTSVGSAGGFSFRLPNLPIPGSGEVFFASVEFDGVVYSGDPISDPVQLDSVHVVRAFPAREAPAGGFVFPVSRREVWIAEGPRGWEVTDVVEIQNPDSATFIPGGVDESVWRYPLPPTALAPRVLQAGPVAGPARVEGTTLVAGNPIVPAANYFVVQYDLESLEMDVPLPGQTGLVQLLLREPAPAIRVEGLARQPPEEIEVGTSFMRWAGEALRDQTIAVRLGEEGGGEGAWLVVAAALSLVLIGAASLLARRRSILAPVGAPRRMRKDILVDVARLDEEHTRAGVGDSRAKERYRRLRAQLLEELARAEEG
jgi:hypothetical protein